MTNKNNCKIIHHDDIQSNKKEYHVYDAQERYYDDCDKKKYQECDVYKKSDNTKDKFDPYYPIGSTYDENEYNQKDNNNNTKCDKKDNNIKCDKKYKYDKKNKDVKCDKKHKYEKYIEYEDKEYDANNTEIIYEIKNKTKKCSNKKDKYVKCDKKYKYDKYDEHNEYNKYDTSG